MHSETNPGSAPNVSLQNVDADGNVIAVAGDYVAAIPTGAAALHQLPPPAADFTGRKEELDELLQQIADHGVAISGVRGMGGIGKTALALVLADRLKDRYPDAQFYLNLKGTSKVPLAATDAMAHVIRGYKPDLKLPDDDAAVRGLYHSVLDGQKALLLMDNAAAAEQVEPLTPPDGCVMLVTSRLRFTIPGLYAKNLDTLAPADAVELIQKIAPRTDEDAAGKIAELCDYLPLALRLSASALAERVDLTPDDFIKRLGDEQKRLSTLDKVDVSIGLSDTLLTEDLRARWYQLAVFPGEFDVLAATAVWEIDAETGKDTLSELVRYSVLEWNKDDQRYHLHDLIRLYVDMRLTSERRDDALLRHAAYFRRVAGAADQLYLKGGDSIVRGLALYDREGANIEAGFAWCSRQASRSPAAAELCSGYPGAVVYCLHVRQHPRRMIHWLESAFSAAKRLGDKEAQGIHLGNLGCAYVSLGEWRRVVDYCQQALDIACRTNNRLGEGNARSGLGLAHVGLGEPRRAIAYHEQHLEIARQIGDRRGEGQALGNLGIAYSELRDSKQAIEFYERNLVVTREIDDRYGESLTLGNLGGSYAILGKPHEALKFAEQHREIAREIGDRYGEAHASWHLGNAYRMLGELPQAIELMQGCVDYLHEIGHTETEKRAAQVEELRQEMREA